MHRPSILRMQQSPDCHGTPAARQLRVHQQQCSFRHARSACDAGSRMVSFNAPNSIMYNWPATMPGWLTPRLAQLQQIRLQCALSCFVQGSILQLLPHARHINQSCRIWNRAWMRDPASCQPYPPCAAASRKKIYSCNQLQTLYHRHSYAIPAITTGKTHYSKEKNESP